MFVVNNLLFPAGCCLITPDSPVSRYQLLTPPTCQGLNTQQVSGRALWFNQHSCWFPGQHCAAILNSSSLCTAISLFFPKRREERVHQLQLVLQQSLENRLRPHQSLVSASSFSREICLWPTFSSWKQLQCFLDFANFIQDYRKVVCKVPRVGQMKEIWYSDIPRPHPVPSRSQPPVHYGARCLNHWGQRLSF